MFQTESIMKLRALAAAIGLTLTVGVQAMPFDKSSLSLKVLSQYQTGVFDDGAAEIVAHDSKNQRIFVINASAATVDVLDINDPLNPARIGEIDVSDLGAGVNSVAIYKDLVAVAIEAEIPQEPGKVGFYNTTDLSFINAVEVGALPDMVTFTPNGRDVLVANEGEPDDDYIIDPEGSVSIIDMRHGAANATVREVDFRKYDGMEDMLRAKGVRIFGPGASASQDFEPEYITVSGNSRFAWVAMQENNTLAVINIRKGMVVDLLPLGTKDHSQPGNELDASNRDDAINITSWPVQGFYMPDAISSYSYRGKSYIVTANEGDSRDYDGFSEEARVEDLVLDAAEFPNAAELQLEQNLGRLKTTVVNGDSNGDGAYETIYSYGARSFSIWTAGGELVYDSGSDFEDITAAELPDDFNSTNDENDSFDNRSDDKGPEPEGIALGKIGNRTIAFIGLERVGGIMAYDITNPHEVRFLDYINNRDFGVDAQLPDKTTNPLVGDLGPEGLVFIRASRSPNGKNLLVVGNEVSGTTTIYEVDVEIPRKAKNR
jgi:2',3'-cyclic-nucleotide 2'-phosphodiesterase/3'-nucleotidase/5'-nucleotidase